MIQQKTKQQSKVWKEIPLSEVLDYEQPNEYIVNEKILEKETPIPVLTPGKSFIKGYTKETEGIYKNVPVIIFDDFTTSSKFVNFPFKVKSSALKILKPKTDLVNLKFVYYQMQTKEINSTTHKRYYLSHYQKLGFLFPIKENGKFDLNTQSQIVSAIETQFTRLEQSIQSLRSIKKKIEIYRKAVLKKEFEGDWKYSKIGKEFKTTSGGTPSRMNKSYYIGNIPWLKSGELMDKLSIVDSEEHISKDALNNSSAKILPVGTVLIAMYGATTGKIGILTEECSTNQAICGIIPDNTYLPKFIFYYLILKRKKLITQSYGGAQPNISQGIIKDLDFPIIEKEKQKTIIREIESKFSVIDKVEEIVNNSLKKSEQLKKSILKSAFKGELVK